jgi:uncharacterized metal-binding protein YceD (DUF177 family)
MAAEHETPPADKPPFSRIVAAEDAGPARQGRIEATPAERERLAAFFRVDNIASLTFDYRLDALPSRRHRLTGEVKGALTQLCGVTLEPVQEHVQEDVSIEFWPAHLLARAADGQPDPQDPLENDPPEPIVDGKIDIGHLAAEIFASAINPYPRKEGVDFAWEDPKARGSQEAAHPFAGLAKLKGKG